MYNLAIKYDCIVYFWREQAMKNNSGSDRSSVLAWHSFKKLIVPHKSWCQLCWCVKFISGSRLYSRQQILVLLWGKIYLKQSNLFSSHTIAGTLTEYERLSESLKFHSKRRVKITEWQLFSREVPVQATVIGHDGRCLAQQLVDQGKQNSF